MKIDYKVVLIFFTLFTLFVPLGFVPLFNLDEGAFS